MAASLKRSTIFDVSGEEDLERDPPPVVRRTGGPGERGREARQRDIAATERDDEAARRDLRDSVREELMSGAPGEDERDLSRAARDDARLDREAAAEDRERAAHDRQVADFERRGRYG